MPDERFFFAIYGSYGKYVISVKSQPLRRQTLHRWTDKSRLAAGGASCGVTMAADVAAAHGEVRAVVLLSGNASPPALKYIAATPALAVFGSVAEADGPADIQQAVAASKNPRSVLKMYPGSEHGVAMFPKNPDLRPMILSWLQTQLR